MKVWCKRYNVLVSGDLLKSAAIEKDKLALPWSSYFRYVIAEYAMRNRSVPWCEYERPKSDVFPRKRFQFGLSKDLSVWIDRQTEQMDVDAGTIVRLILTERLGVENVLG